MRIIHTGDIHLDANLKSRIGELKARERKNEILNTFLKMIDYAGANDVSAILICGDLFDTLSVSATTRNRILDAINSHGNIAFFYLRGNHDFESFLLLNEEKPSNLLLFDDEWKYYVLGKNKSIVVAGIELSENNYLELYDSLELDLNTINIVMLHGMISKSFGPLEDEIINISKLKDSNIDYLALGHIHGHLEERLNARADMIYPGCIDPRGFDEPGEHGFVLIDIDEETGYLNHDFIPFASRRVYELEADVAECMTTPEILAKVRGCLLEYKVTDKDMIRVNLTGKMEFEAEKDLMTIQNILEEEYWYIEVKDKTSVRFDYDSFALDKSLKGAFVREVLSHTEFTQEQKDRIINYGLTAIAGGEVGKCV